MHYHIKPTAATRHKKCYYNLLLQIPTSSDAAGKKPTWLMDELGNGRTAGLK